MNEVRRYKFASTYFPDGKMRDFVLASEYDALKAQALDTARALADRTYELTLAHQELERWKAEAASENEKANRLFADLEKVTKEASR